jgi:hypothetical protein
MQVRKRFQRTVGLDIDALCKLDVPKSYSKLYDMFQKGQPPLLHTRSKFLRSGLPLSIEIASSRVSISQWWACCQVA